MSLVFAGVLTAKTTNFLREARRRPKSLLAGPEWARTRFTAYSNLTLTMGATTMVNRSPFGPQVTWYYAISAKAGQPGLTQVAADQAGRRHRQSHQAEFCWRRNQRMSRQNTHCVSKRTRLAENGLAAIPGHRFRSGLSLEC